MNTVALLLAILLANCIPVHAACHDYVLINTHGTGEPQGESIGFRGMISDVLAALPNGVRYDTVYPAAPDLTQQTTFIGSSDIGNEIQQGLQSCPEQRYALLGYSQGATVTNEVLQAFSPTSAQGQSIEAIVLVGNPYHRPNKAGNVDEDCGTSTAGASGVLLPTANYTIPDAWYATGKVRDICFTDDPVCSGYDLGTLFSPSHFFYGFSKSVQECGREFLVEMLS
ncbi:carbohydrate esterase family 5 protein [Zasmidium cellare ATCC 36951]|uniref:Carbohydrate esterase family 5 protein n=1 Tax=Zasmidium cellare ATCC 36951 TaxID=1080233 RepID=A0A6A6CFM4_ZASCE|nr:carbohydrate esterase family 5 protein [Zasmidium cellare ATCC 36951]KAF2164206.1 carbohydrate esterase family 5 protein [Zasmidium cellare ATCC 36951]